MSGIFIGSAFLSLASSHDLGGVDDPPVLFFGMTVKASSLLAIMGAIGGIGGALLMPLMGAIVDHTPYRRAVGICSWMVICAINLACSFMNKGTGWQWVGYLSVVGGWFYSAHCVCMYAYLPEVEDAYIAEKKAKKTKQSAVVDKAMEEAAAARPAAAAQAGGDDDDGEKVEPGSVVPRTTSRQTAIQFLSQFLFLVGVIIISLFFSVALPKDYKDMDKEHQDFEDYKNGLKNNLTTNKISMLATFIVGGSFYAWAWRVLPSRPALHPLPLSTPVHRLFLAGFRKLLKTTVHMFSDFRELAVFLISVSFAEAGNLTFATLAVTYTTTTLKMTTSESGILFAIVLIFAVPGAILWNKFVTSKIGKIKSCMLGTLLWGVVTTIAPFFMQNPSQKTNSYIFGAIWGFLFGAYGPPQSAVYVSMIPRGQESELMGVYIFAGQILVWLPPLIFSIMNERGVNMLWGLFMDACFFYVAFIIMFFYVYPRYDRAVEKARKSDFMEEEDIGPGIEMEQAAVGGGGAGAGVGGPIVAATSTSKQNQL